MKLKIGPNSYIQKRIETLDALNQCSAKQVIGSVQGNVFSFYPCVYDGMTFHLVTTTGECCSMSVLLTRNGTTRAPRNYCSLVPPWTDYYTFFNDTLFMDVNHRGKGTTIRQWGDLQLPGGARG